MISPEYQYSPPPEKHALEKAIHGEVVRLMDETRLVVSEMQGFKESSESKSFHWPTKKPLLIPKKHTKVSFRQNNAYYIVNTEPIGGRKRPSGDMIEVVRTSVDENGVYERVEFSLYNFWSKLLSSQAHFEYYSSDTASTPNRSLDYRVARTDANYPRGNAIEEIRQTLIKSEPF